MDVQLPKSFSDLQAEAAARWAEIGRLRAEKFQKIADEIAMSQDVVEAPQVGTTWSHEKIACPVCTGSAFIVNRYGCVNGIKDKCDLTCATCGYHNTWSWPLGAFMEL